MRSAKKPPPYTTNDVSCSLID